MEWLQSTWVGVLVAESLWGYPLFETIHSLGMAMLIGALGLINLRVLGFKRELPLLGMRQLLPLAWLFGVNPNLGDRRPIDLIRMGRTEELMHAIRAERADSFA